MTSYMRNNNRTKKRKLSQMTGSTDINQLKALVSGSTFV